MELSGIAVTLCQLAGRLLGESSSLSPIDARHQGRCLGTGNFREGGKPFPINDLSAGTWILGIGATGLVVALRLIIEIDHPHVEKVWT